MTYKNYDIPPSKFVPVLFSMCHLTGGSPGEGSGCARSCLSPHHSSRDRSPCSSRLGGVSSRR